MLESTRRAARSPFTACIVAALTASSAALASDSRAAENRAFVDVDPPPGARISVLSYSGSGCPEDTANVVLTPDRRTFLVSYSAFVATVDASTKTDEKECVLKLKIDAPTGYDFSIEGVTYRGDVFLENEDVVATRRSRYKFGDPAEKPLMTNRWTGYLDEYFSEIDDLSSVALGAGCGNGNGKHLNIRTVTRVRNKGLGHGYGTVIVESTDGRFAGESYRLKWRRCP